ncbi:hypothetical protein BKA70DRAFT_1113336, partial [Coprinopsis sp. MPI-PUGE-AT-0042]
QTLLDWVGETVQAVDTHNASSSFQHLPKREHILTTCSRYDTWRWKLSDVSRDIVLSEILGTPRGIEALASFLEISGAFSRTGTITIANPQPERYSDVELSEHDENSTIGPEPFMTLSIASNLYFTAIRPTKGTLV